RPAYGRACRGSAERVAQAVEADVERLVRHREREAGSAGASLAEALAGSERHPCLRQQALRRPAVRQHEPDEERALAARIERRQSREDAVAAALVGGAPLLDGFL